MIAYSWPPFDSTSVTPAPLITVDHCWRNKREQVQCIDTIALVICTTSLPQHSNTYVYQNVSAPMCSCVLMSGLYLRFREADNLDPLPSLHYSSHHTESPFYPSSHLRLIRICVPIRMYIFLLCKFCCSRIIREIAVRFASIEWALNVIASRSRGPQHPIACSLSMQTTP